MWENKTNHNRHFIAYFPSNSYNIRVAQCLECQACFFEPVSLTALLRCLYMKVSTLGCIVCMSEQRIEAEGRKHGQSRTCWRQSAYVRRWRSTPTCVQRESQSSSSTICTKRTSTVLSTSWTASATVQSIPSSGCILRRPTTATESAAAPAGKRKHKSYIGQCSIGFLGDRL